MTSPELVRAGAECVLPRPACRNSWRPRCWALWVRGSEWESHLFPVGVCGTCSVSQRVEASLEVRFHGYPLCGLAQAQSCVCCDPGRDTEEKGTVGVVCCCFACYLGVSRLRTTAMAVTPGIPASETGQWWTAFLRSLSLGPQPEHLAIAGGVSSEGLFTCSSGGRCWARAPLAGMPPGGHRLGMCVTRPQTPHSPR